MSTPNYCYIPLSDPYSIRVFILQPAGKFHEPLVGSLREVILPDKSPIQLLKEKAIQLGCQNLADLPDAIFETTIDTIYDSERIRYEVVSYVWGAKCEGLSILCDERSISVTKNCDEMLRYLRRHDGERTLWVDAICIDQGSDTEKSTQVALMGHIYKSAFKVTIWFGPSRLDVEAISTEARWGKWLRDTLPRTVSRNILGKCNEVSFSSETHSC